MRCIYTHSPCLPTDLLQSRGRHGERLWLERLAEQEKSSVFLSYTKHRLALYAGFNQTQSRVLRVNGGSQRVRGRLAP